MILLWRKAYISLCAIRQTSKINMFQDGPYSNIHHITLMIVSTVLSSDSSSAILKTVECEIEYQNYRKSMQKYYLHFESKTNLIVSNLTFELGPCKAAMKYCKKQKYVICTREIIVLMVLSVLKKLIILRKSNQLVFYHNMFL